MGAWLKANKGLAAALVLTLLFVVADFFLLKKDNYNLMLVPLALLTLWLIIAKFEQSLLCMALLTPFAIDIALLPGMEMSLPAEPMMILFSAIFLFRVLLNRTYDRQILRHPVTLSIIASLLWMIITSATSLLPLVSFKYTIARLWFVIPFYFAAVHIFRNQTRASQFYWAYAIGLSVVILIATTKTVGNFSNLQTLHRVMRPFYNDHTAYGCVIALMLPVAVVYLFQYLKKGLPRLLGLIFLALLCIGLFFSYCRAAWLSVIAAIGVYLLIRMGMKVRWMFLLFGLAVGVFFAYQGDVLYKLGKNKQDSSYNLVEQVKSISNISTDASNLERLNRWASALRIWKEHPVNGIGPGTYQFVYGKYQRSYQLSTISTNNGDLGNAHSEYIGPLTEQGVVGAGLMVAIFFITFATGVHTYRRSHDKRIKSMALAFTLSLLTYYVHGVFNNFLDTDKLSVPFWGFTAIIVALDILSREQNTKDEKSNS